MTPRDDGNRGDVLSSLPAKRPQRPSARRAAGAARAPASGRKQGPRSAAPRGGAAARPARSQPRSGARAAKKTPRKPAAVRPSAATTRAREPGPRAVPRSRRPEASAPAPAPEGVELVTTAIQAAAELAQIGLGLGASALRGAINRLPRP